MPDLRASVVMPVLNGMPWLPEAFVSIRDQAGVEFELIVLDGGSTDGSRAWLKEHRGKAHLVLEPDRGQTDALIRGFSLARGAVLGWLNADDVYESNALSTVVETFERHPDAVAVSGACLLIDGHGAVTGSISRLGGGSLASLLDSNVNLPQPATFFRREAYHAVGGLDAGLALAMDVDLWLKLASIGTIELIPETLARFRIHESAKTQISAKRALQEDWTVRRRHGMPLLSRAAWRMWKQTYLRPLKERLVGPNMES